MLIKRNLIITASIVAVVTLCGCGNGASENIENVAQTAEEKAAPEPVENTVAQTDVGGTDVGAEEKEEAKEDTKEDKEEDVTSVYGNGSYFVKAGRKVFFHDYENVEADEPALGGQFLGLGSGIISYDEDSGQIERITDEPCNGKIYLCGDEFYFAAEESDGSRRIVRISQSGEVYRVGPGEVLGISGDGKLIALWCNDASRAHLDVLDDQHVQFCRIDKPDDGALSFCGLTEKELIYQVSTSGESKLCSMGDDNKEVCLGTLSRLGIYGDLECDDFLYDEETGDIYCVFAHYDGPVDSVEDYLVVKASAVKEGSLELISHGYNYDLMPGLSYGDEPTLRLVDGKLGFGFYDEDQLYLSHSYMGSHMLNRFVYGNLLWCDDKGEIQTIIKSFIPYMDRDNFVMQTGQVLGNEAYVLVAGVKRDEASDYKLSQSFDFEKMYVLSVPLEEKSKAELILGDDFDDKKTFDAAGFEPYVGNWRMDDFIVEDGITPSHSRNMWIGITDEQELSFMDNDEYSGFPFILSTSDIGDECLIVGYNEVMEITCTGRIVKDGNEEKLILEVQEQKSSIDDSGPDSWKGSFHRVTDEEWEAEWGSDH